MHPHCRGGEHGRPLSHQCGSGAVLKHCAQQKQLHLLMFSVQADILRRLVSCPDYPQGATL